MGLDSGPVATSPVAVGCCIPRAGTSHCGRWNVEDGGRRRCCFIEVISLEDAMGVLESGMYSTNIVVYYVETYILRW